MWKASEQDKARDKAKSAQARYYKQQREAVGTPEQYEPGFYESFMREEEPKLSAWAASRGLTRSSDVERQQTELQLRGREGAKRAALERWRAQAPYAQAAAEGAYSEARVGGPDVGEAAWGGLIEGVGETVQGWFPEAQEPVFSGVTPGFDTGGGDEWAGMDAFGWGGTDDSMFA
jgi:hypothetical protein